MAPLEHMESVLRAILEMDRPNVVYENICWTIPPGAAEPRGFCGVCSLFTDPAFIKDLFQKNCYQLGSWGDLKTWARNGCQLCKYIEQEFFKELHEDDACPDDAALTLKWEMDMENSDDDPHDDEGTIVPHEESSSISSEEIESMTFQISWLGLGFPGNFPTFKAKRVSMECFCEEESILSRYVRTRPVSSRVDSDDVFSNVKMWMNRCLQHHDCCGTLNDPPELPTRVLDVLSRGNEDKVQLYESNHHRGSYVALSYVWGGDQPYKTTQTNLNRYQNEISVSTLSKTIQDAIKCTRKLQVRYLWVDALCIIQDSEDDKAREIEQMTQIYKNSMLTISAAKSKNCFEGFLEPRVKLNKLADDSFVIPMAIPFEVSALDEIVPESGEFFIGVERFPGPRQRWMLLDSWYPIPYSMWLARREAPLQTPDMMHEPVSTRAWTLQETWLSPRLLMFGSGQPSWQCAKASECHGGTISWEVDQSHRIELFAERSPSITNDIWEQLSWPWQQILGEYMRRDLTEGSDKLRALDGIVQEFKRVTRDEYMLGLWKSKLIQGLSWYQDTASKHREKIKWGESRFCSSWTWAKVDGDIDYSYAENSKASVVSCGTPNVAVTSGMLFATCKLKIKAPIACLTRAQMKSHFRVWLTHSSRPALINVIHPDGASHNTDFSRSSGVATNRDTFYFLELSWGKDGGIQNVASESRGLVLVMVDDEENTFRRTGFYFVALETVPDWEGVHVSSVLTRQEFETRLTPFGREWNKMLGIRTITLV